MKLRKNEILRFQFLVLGCFVASGALAAAANYWIGADGADLADANNWEYYISGVAQGTHALPTNEAGYFANKSGLSQYSMSLSTDLSLQQLYWFLGNMKTVINLGGHTLSLGGASNADIRMNNDGADSTMTNGTLTVADKVWLLGNNQTLTFGEGMTFNGSASLHSSVAYQNIIGGR